MATKSTPKDNFVTTLLNSLSQGAQGGLQGAINPMQQFMQSTGAPTHTKTGGMISEQVVPQIKQAAQDIGTSVALPAIQATGSKPTPEQYEAAKRGSETAFGMLSGQTEGRMAAPAIKIGAEVGKDIAKAGAQAGKKAVQEAVDIAGTQPGGLQAGFVKLPPIGKVAAQEYPFVKEPGKISKLGTGMDQKTRQIRLPADIGGAQAENEVHSTLNRLGFQGSGEQQYSQLQPAMSKLSNFIEDRLASNPQLVKKQTISENLDKQLSDLFRRGDIPQKNAQQELLSYQKELGMATKNITFENNPALSAQENTINQLLAQNPDMISTIDLYKMKKIANADASNVYKKVSNNTALNDRDKVILAYRNALDTALTGADKTIKQATMDMSRLYDATPSLEKARFNAPKGMDVLPPIVKSVLPPPVASGINKTLTNPTVIKTGLGIAGAGGLLGSGYLLGQNAKNNQDPSQDSNSNLENDKVNQHGQSVSNYYQNVKSDESGHYQLPTQGESTGTFMTAAQRQALEANLTPGTPEYQRIEQKYAQDQAMASKIATPEVSAFMKRAIPVQQNANNVYDALKGGQLPMSLIHRFDTWNDVQKYADPKYQTFATQLDGLNGGFNSLYKTVTGEAPSKNMLISPKDSQGQATAKLAYMTNFFAGTYGQYKDAYAATTSPSGQLGNTGQPQAAPMPQQEAPANASAVVQTGALPPINLPPIQ